MRLPSVRALLVVGCVAALSACGGSAVADRTAPGGSAPPAGPATVKGEDWTRFNDDAQRSGVGPGQTGLTASTVHSLARRTIAIPGVADSSAVELRAVRVGRRTRDLAIVTTTYGRTLAFDPGTGAILWRFVPRDIAAYQGSHQITTASPVLDPDRRFVYVTSPDGLVRKLAVATGREVRRASWPARVTFDPRREKLGGSLNLSGPYVVAVTGGYYGDAPTYQGHVAMIERGSGRVAHVWNALCAGRHRLIAPPSACPASDAAIWARSGAVIEPGSGRILVATGNGPYNGSTNWGDSVLELSPNAAGLLQSWTPSNQAELEAGDIDLGSTAPALLPPLGGRRLAVQGGKQGKLYLLELVRLNGTPHAGPRLGGELGAVPAPGGGEVLTAPTVWAEGSRTYVFVANDSGTAGYVLTGGGRPRLQQIWSASSPGTSPLVAGGLLYVYDHVGGKLVVRNPTSGARLASLPAAPGHWNSPIVVGGRIILPVGGSSADDDLRGVVYVYHLRGR